MNEEKRAKKKVNMQFKFTRFALPPVRDALVIGHRASIGANAITKAFDVMLPGLYKMISVEHPVIEAIMIRKSILRKINEDTLVSKILTYSESMMDETESMRIELNIEVTFTEEIEVE